MTADIIYEGPEGFAQLVPAIADGCNGALLGIGNPRSKINTVPPEALAEISAALDAFEAQEKRDFLILHGEEAGVHAGAEMTMFAGGLQEDPPDYEGIHRYLEMGAGLDIRLKRMSGEVTTVSIMQGERFGGSVEWPLMTSFCVACTDAGIQFSEVNVGIIPGWDGIMNVLLRSGPLNALYLGTTGSRLTAPDMQQAGLANHVAEPAEAMEAALSIAASPPRPPAREDLRQLADFDFILSVLSQRLDVKRYEALAEETKAMQGDLEAKELAKYIDRRLAEIGKPVAPLAVEAVFGLVAKGAGLDPSDIDAVEELALDEVASCSNLMKTNDRVTGVNSVLGVREDVLNKIAIFNRS